MAWESEIYIQNKLWDEFQFFNWNSTVMSQIIAPERLFRLGTIRVHLSTAFASVEDLVIRLSSIKGSRYNAILLSQPMFGVRDLIWMAASAEMLFLSGDQVICTMSTALSGAVAVNAWGLTAIGWQVQSRV